MKKILFFMVVSASFLFSAINLQTASKEELMCIKGIGDKKADAIIKYRKSNKLKSADDLIEIKGFGKKIIEKVKNNEKTITCGGKKSSKKKSTKKSVDSKKNTKAKDSKSTKKEDTKAKDSKPVKKEDTKAKDSKPIKEDTKSDNKKIDSPSK